MSKFEKEQVFKYPKMIVCGYGIVGKHIKEDFPFAQTYDPDSQMGADFIVAPKDRYDIAFIVVPTPCNADGSCNTTFVEAAVSEISADLYVMKSTVPPKTCDELSKKTGKTIVFSPEFYGATQFANVGTSFVIIGGENAAYHKLRQAYELVKNGDFKFYHCTNIEAEIIKYMENSFLAMKVVFCNQFKEICDIYGASYDAVRDGVTNDPRIGLSHTYVFDNHPGYDSKCLNKDIPAFIQAIKANGYEKDFIMSHVDAINKGLRK